MPRHITTKIVLKMLLSKILLYNVNNNFKVLFTSHGSPHPKKLRLARTREIAFLGGTLAFVVQS